MYRTGRGFYSLQSKQDCICWKCQDDDLGRSSTVAAFGSDGRLRKHLDQAAGLLVTLNFFLMCLGLTQGGFLAKNARRYLFWRWKNMEKRCQKKPEDIENNNNETMLYNAQFKLICNRSEKALGFQIELRCWELEWEGRHLESTI